jgi:hypothetical protein
VNSYRAEVARYYAEGETGAIYIVIAYREDRTHSELWSKRTLPDSVPTYQLDDGRELAFLGGGEFELVETGEVIWTVVA